MWNYQNVFICVKKSILIEYTIVSRNESGTLIKSKRQDGVYNFIYKYTTVLRQVEEETALYFVLDEKKKRHPVMIEQKRLVAYADGEELIVKLPIENYLINF